MSSETFTSHILMVRPYLFRGNEQTLINNSFQNTSTLSTKEITIEAQKEFDTFVKILKQNSITVSVYQDDGVGDTPDSIFPNNWVSFHHLHKIVLYPMFAENRRIERTPKIFEFLKKEGIHTHIIKDYSHFEKKELFLEGTGSMILDRENKIVYASLSERTNKKLVNLFCEEMKYTPIIFNSYTQKKYPIYHTNVIMALGNKFALIALECIKDKEEQMRVTQELARTGKKIIPLSENQINEFAGNALFVLGKDNTPFLVMSSNGYKSLERNQVKKIEKYAEIIHSPLDTIEYYGGGSARCMMAEIF